MPSRGTLEPRPSTTVSRSRTKASKEMSKTSQSDSPYRVRRSAGRVSRLNASIQAARPARVDQMMAMAASPAAARRRPTHRRCAPRRARAGSNVLLELPRRAAGSAAPHPRWHPMLRPMSQELLVERPRLLIRLDVELLRRIASQRCMPQRQRGLPLLGVEPHQAQSTSPATDRSPTNGAPTRSPPPGADKL